jgi:hypothetical protein
MNRSHFIFEFIDGALDSAREQELFDDLARHPELRSELRHYYAMGEAVRADREAFVPPAGVERALMSGLGIAPGASIGAGIGGAAAVTTVAAAGLGSRFLFFRNYLPVLASFLVGALFAGAGVYIGLNERAISRVDARASRDTVYIQQSAAAPSLASAQPGEVAQGTPAPRTQSAAIAAPTRVRSAEPSIVRDRATRRGAAVMEAQSPAVTERETSAPTVDAVASEPMRDLLAVDARTAPPAVMSARGESTSEEAALRTPEITPLPLDRTIASRGGELGFLELRRTVVARPYVTNNAREVTEGAFDEAAIAMYVRTGTSTLVGVEVGEGRYAQSLVLPENYIANGRDYSDVARVDQSPSVYWFGVGGRVEIGEIMHGVNWWGQGTLAYGIGNGPIVNSRLGVSTEIATALTATGALETSTLFYTFEDQNLVTGKFGLTLGLQYGW